MSEQSVQTGYKHSLFHGTELATLIGCCCSVRRMILGGTCLNGYQSFVCVCEPGLSGTLCETGKSHCPVLLTACARAEFTPDIVLPLHFADIDECASNPCLNGASCVDKFNAFECQCLSGFRGAQCQLSVDECQYQPCMNGGCTLTRESFCFAVLGLIFSVVCRWHLCGWSRFVELPMFVGV